MELTPRKQAVLKAIVKAYIETGEPIGSKNLGLLIENAPSSATLRNEMSELCSLGLLNQPHTSAGRVPTSMGYKLYVDSLMSPKQIDGETAGLIEKTLSAADLEPESIPTLAAKLLTQITGLPAIACLITEKPPKIKRVELLPIGKLSVMLLIITDDGRTRSRIFRHGGNLTNELRNRFEELVELRVKGKRVSELNRAYMQSVIAEAGLFALELMPLLTAVFETAGEIEAASVVLKGENALYNICSDEKTARKIQQLIKRRDPIISVLESIGDNAGAVFGTDTAYSELESDAIVAARFSTTDKYKGYVGVIGPNRMSYDKVMPCIEYTAKMLTEIMTKAQNDMED